MAMKLGNYKWVLCNKCGKRYAQIPGGKEHKCKESLLKKFINQHKKARADKVEQHMNDLFNAGEDDRGNPIF
jgi:hypothetical protein